jgi:hypothetical protein
MKTARMPSLVVASALFAASACATSKTHHEAASHESRSTRVTNHAGSDAVDAEGRPNRRSATPDPAVNPPIAPPAPVAPQGPERPRGIGPTDPY